MGEVYLAQDTRLDRKVAVKILLDLMELDHRVDRVSARAKNACDFINGQIGGAGLRALSLAIKSLHKRSSMGAGTPSEFAVVAVACSDGIPSSVSRCSTAARSASVTSQPFRGVSALGTRMLFSLNSHSLKSVQIQR